MSKERLEKIKKDVIDNSGYIKHGDFYWLISEVERLQAYILNETVPKQFDTGHLLAEKQEVERLYTEYKQKAERLEKENGMMWKWIKQGDEPLTKEEEKKISKWIYEKQALETEGKE
jgi:hypothetical protein